MLTGFYYFNFCRSQERRVRATQDKVQKTRDSKSRLVYKKDALKYLIVVFDVCSTELFCYVVKS